MSEKNAGSIKNQPSTSTNLKPDPKHGGLVRFKDVVVNKLFYKETQPVEHKLQDPAIRAVCRLQSAAGVQCLQKPDGHVVTFKDWDAVEGYKKKFWIKFACEEGQWKISKYNMPSCFDKKKLEAANGGESLNIKQFLIDCKTLVERFTRRKQQFKKLEDFLKSSDLYCAILYADPSYKVFSIRLERNVQNRFKEPSLIVVKLGYLESITMPTKLVIESASHLELSESDREIFHNYFKVLKLVDVAEALEQIFNSPESKGIWKRQSSTLEEHGARNNKNRSSRKTDESLESDDSSQGLKRKNEETLNSSGEKRSRLLEDSFDTAEWETQDKNAKASNKGRKKLKTVKKVATSGGKNKKKSEIRGESSPERKNVKSTDKSKPQGQNSPANKKRLAKASSSNRENREISKIKKQKSSGAKKNSEAKLPAKKKK